MTDEKLMKKGTAKPKAKKRGRKKKAVAEEEVPTNGAKMLTKFELSQLDLHQARVDMQATVLQNLQMKEELLRIDYVQKRDVLRGKQLDTTRSMEECKTDYNRTRVDIQERLGMSLDNCTVRQDGTVIEIDEDGNPMNFVGDTNDGG